MPVRAPRYIEPPLYRGHYRASAPGYHRLPPRVRSRFDAPRRCCPHCELIACTRDAHCPVCAAPYFPTLWSRLLARWRDE